MMKKALAAIIALALLTTLSIFAESVSIQNYNQKIRVDDEVINLPSIVYNQENYVKLRDFDVLLTKLNSGFAVEYDFKTKMISVDTTAEYKAIGTELKDIGEAREAILSEASLSIDKALVDIKAIEFKGHNYFKLKELAAVFNSNVEYDNKTGVVNLTVNKIEVKEIKPGDTLKYAVIKSEGSAQSEGYTWEKTSDNKIIVKFTKRFPTGGYQLNVQKIIYNGKSIIITPLVIGPPTDAMVTQVITYPTCTVEIDTAGLPEEFDVIVESIDNTYSDR